MVVEWLERNAQDDNDERITQQMEWFTDATVSSVVVVYHVTIVAIGHGLLKKFWPLVLGCVLRTAGSSII